MIESIVVPYHFSTSNHNFGEVLYIVASVVPYHFSTSNHNLRPRWRARLLVVPYHFSTSNHNPRCSIIILIMLYLITFLHQTTTIKPLPFEYLRLYLITFLHQTTTPHASCIKNHTFTKEYTSTNSSIHTRRSRFDAIFCISKNKNNANSEKFQLLGNFRLGTFDLTHKIQNITILLIRNTQNTRISRRRHRLTYTIDMHLHILL